MEHWLAGGVLLLSMALAGGRSWLKAPPSASPVLAVFKQRSLSPFADFFYFAGLPYLAVITGLLSPRLLGLKGLEHLALVNFSGNLAADTGRLQSALSLMIVEWFIDAGPMLFPTTVAFLALISLTVSLNRTGAPVISTQTTWPAVIYQGLHWAFYRALCWFITGDLYLAVVLGAGAVLVEAGVSAWLQKMNALEQPRLLMDLILLLLTSTVFYYSPNLWLLWLVQGGMVVVIYHTTPPTIRNGEFNA